MANDAEPDRVIRITAPFSEDAWCLCMKETFSDVVLIVDKERLFAHKVILGTRCRYFETLLKRNPNVTEITLPNVSSEPFKKILQYLYTGFVDLPSSDTFLILEVMKLANNFLLKEFELKISEATPSIVNFENIFDFLNKANEYDMDVLKKQCLHFIEEHIPEILKNDNLTTLTQKSIVSLFESDNFSVPEIEIFKAIQKWCQVNNDVNGLAANCIRLDHLSNDEIKQVVFPSKLVGSEKLITFLADRTDNKPKARRSSGKNEDIGVNFATKENGTKIISGQNTAWLLTDNNKYLQFAYHKIGEGRGITINLRNPFFLNHIQLRLYDENFEYFYSYYVDVSVDGRKWKPVVNYSSYKCRSFQKLYFEKTYAQYVRIVGTQAFGPLCENFRLISFKIFCAKNTSKVKEGLICPTQDILSLGSVIYEQSPGQWNLLQNKMEHICFKLNNTKTIILIHLGQPYVISNMRFFLEQSCSYYIETSTDYVKWVKVINYRSRYRHGWQNLVFEERPVLYIKITADKTLLQLRCGHFEIPSCELSSTN